MACATLGWGQSCARFNNLTSTYFECDPPDEGKRKFGYSRDKRSDCVQVVIALIVRIFSRSIRDQTM